MVTVGDGLTEGGVADATAWPDFLDPTLWTVDNVAVGGSTSTMWANDAGLVVGRLDPPFVTQIPSVITVMFGTDDILAEESWQLLEANLVTWANTQVKPRYPNAEIVIMQSLASFGVYWHAQPPLWWQLDAGIWLQRQGRRNAHRTLGLITPVLDVHDDALIDYGAGFTPDGLHWSEQINEQVADAVNATILSTFLPTTKGVLRQSERDLEQSLEDALAGTGTTMTITDPSGTAADLTGHVIEIGAFVDLETGQLVSVQHGHVAVRMSRLISIFGAELPDGKPASDEKSWLIVAQDIVGTRHRYRVTESALDRTLGIVRMQLDRWELN